MLLANREVSDFVSKLAAKIPESKGIFLYRIHDEPKADRIDELGTFVRAIGYEFGTKSQKKYSAKDIKKLLEQIKGKPEEHLIRTATLRSMAKAIYSTKTSALWPLVEYYSHFTSPIRRYQTCSPTAYSRAISMAIAHQQRVRQPREDVS